MLKSIKQKATRIIAKKKIVFEGSAIGEEFWNVAGVKITVQTIRILTDKGVAKKEDYWCTCLDCTTKRIPNSLEPRCCFVEALKQWKKNLIKEST